VDSYGSYFFFRAGLILGIEGALEEAKNTLGNVLRLIQSPFTASSFEKISQPVKPIRRMRESPIPVPETWSAFHPRAQRTAFRRRGACQQSRLFAPLGING
jgi:hypothetical protein